MFLGSRNPNLTLLFSCEYRERMHEHAHAQKYFKMHDVYQNKCFLCLEIKIWNFFFHVSTLHTCMSKHTLKNTLKCMFYTKIYVFGVKKSKSDIMFSWEYHAHMHEHAHAPKYFKIHDVYQNICFLGPEIQICYHFFHVSMVRACTSMHAHKNTLKWMKYIKIYVFWVKKSKSDIIFFVRALCASTQTCARARIL